MKNKKVFRIVITALMSALCYAVFTLVQIKIPTPAGYTSFHLGNVFCVLTALLIDGISGGLAGAIGMGIADVLDPVYVISAPKTVILKFLIGFVTGTLAHQIFQINEKENPKKEVILSACGGMLFNVIAEPVFSYIYYSLILGNAEKAASYITIAKWITTSVNALLTIVISTLLYMPLKKALKNYL